jgi:hypothetical protein
MGSYFFAKASCATKESAQVGQLGPESLFDGAYIRPSTMLGNEPGLLGENTLVPATGRSITIL